MLKPYSTVNYFSSCRASCYSAEQKGCSTQKRFPTGLVEMMKEAYDDKQRLPCRHQNRNISDGRRLWLNLSLQIIKTTAVRWPKEQSRGRSESRWNEKAELGLLWWQSWVKLMQKRIIHEGTMGWYATCFISKEMCASPGFVFLIILLDQDSSHGQSG